MNALRDYSGAQVALNSQRGSLFPYKRVLDANVKARGHPGASGVSLASIKMSTSPLVAGDGPSEAFELAEEALDKIALR